MLADLDFATGWGIGLHLLAGVGLAAAAGLRAFLPPFVIGLLGRFQIVELRDGLDWLSSTPALVLLGTAVVAEILADKIPVVDHALDAVATFVKPAAGAAVIAAPLVDVPPLWTAVLAIVLGGGVAGTVHLGKSALRLASTGATAGVGNPVISAAEDGLSLAGTVLALFYPVALAVLVLVAAFLMVRAFRRFRAGPAIRPRQAPR